MHCSNMQTKNTTTYEILIKYILIINTLLEYPNKSENVLLITIFRMFSPYLTYVVNNFCLLSA